MYGLLRILGLFILPLVITSCISPAPIKVGLIVGQTGKFSDLGQEGMRGAILAIEQRNASGGIAGRSIRLLIRDDGQRAEQARKEIKELIDQGVEAVIGPMTSSMARILVDEADKARIVLVGGTVVTNQLSSRDDYFFRVIGSSANYAVHTARTHIKMWPLNRVAVVYDEANSDYAQDWASTYAETIKNAGLNPVRLLAIDSRSTLDIKEKTRELHMEPLDLIVFVCNSRTAGLLMKDLREAKSTARFATSAWAGESRLIEIAGSAAEEALVEHYFDPQSTGLPYRNFIDSYSKRFGRPPDFASMIAFEATQFLLDGLERGPERKGLKNVLLSLGKARGLQADIGIDPNGDAQRPTFTAVIRNGKFETLR